MNASASLSLTQKGVDEALNRAYKLSVRQRSVLILLGKPQTLEYVLKKQEMFDPEEVLEVIGKLSDEGFIEISAGILPRAAPPTPVGVVELLDGIIISEAKFLLVDFCVDSFGTRAQKFVDELGSCKNEKQVRTCLKDIYMATVEHSPVRLAVLLKIVADINETA